MTALGDTSAVGWIRIMSYPPFKLKPLRMTVIARGRAEAIPAMRLRLLRAIALLRNSRRNEILRSVFRDRAVTALP